MLPASARVLPRVLCMHVCVARLSLSLCVPRAWVPAVRRQYARMRHVPRGVHACAPRQAAVSERIEVVTADKELRRAASGVHKNVKLINPVKWCAARAL